MEKELLDTFETAKKSAEAASAGGGPAEVDRCVDALRQLRRIPVTKKALVDTQIGKSLRSLRKHPEEKIQSLASDLFEHWKKVVVEETSKDTKKNQTSEDKKPMKVQVKTERSETIKVEKVSKSLSVKVEKINSNGGLKAEKVSYSQSVKIEKSESLPTKKLPPSVIAPPKLSSMLKCNDPVRDKVRELLAEALSRVPKETRESDVQEVRNILDEVDVSDPIRVAVTVESALFERLGSSKGEHNVKYRSIMFNLKDSKNPDFRRRVLLGEVKPSEIADLMPDDMASDERKATNRQIKEKAMFECERAGAPKPSTDQFKCGRCGQRKCTYYQLQTRSADEPMTTFVTCVNCNNHWKFC